MIVLERYPLKRENITDLISVYYKGQGKKAESRSIVNEDGTISYTVIEVLKNGSKSEEKILNNDELDNMIFTVFTGGGLEVGDIVHYGLAGTKVKDGMFATLVTEKTENQIVVVTKREEKVLYK